MFDDMEHAFPKTVPSESTDTDFPKNAADPELKVPSAKTFAAVVSDEPVATPPLTDKFIPSAHASIDERAVVQI